MTERDAFFEALDQPTPEARAAYLERIGSLNPALRAAVENLLQHHRDDAFLETPALQLLTSDISPATPRPEPPLPPVEKPGSRIGPYKLLEKIGEGGVGIVFMAEQLTPIRRRVALKILKPGMDSQAVIARFESERQALALMDHPHIARVLDAGTTPTGRPFFVMELVAGVRITEYCDRNRLTVPERLRLFLQVCHAVQHAHQKGIIHRDIKPSNVLVTLHDGAPRAKVIDFGIAKALDHPLTDKTIHTELRSFLGTPAYMSPEQADLGTADLDTRTDIYSLGVLLYELLIGHTPFDEKELTRAGLDSLRRILREQDPLPPSRRYRNLPPETQTAIAARRRTDPSRLAHLLQGDLDWITLKALEKDRARRYATAHDLARDIERHLDNEPVLARPPGTLYRLGKLVRRHRVASLASAIALVALLSGLALATWQYTEKSHAYQRALRAEREQARLRQEAETARRLAEHRAHLARLRAYAADMNLVQQALAANNLGRARELLDRHRPGQPSPGPTPTSPDSQTPSPTPDLRGWEWRYLWRLCQSDALFTLCQLPHEIQHLAVSHDGRLVAIAQPGNHGLTIWDLRSRSEHLRLPPDLARPPFAFSPAGPLLAFVAGEKAPDKPNHELPDSATPPGTQTPTEHVCIWNWETRSFQARIPLPDRVTALAFSGDGQRLLVTVGDTLFTLWSLPNATPLGSIPFPWPEDTGRAILGSRTTFTPDLRLAAQALGNGRVRVLDLEQQRLLWSNRVAEENVTALALSPDGHFLATAGGFVEPTVRIWDARSGRPVARLEGHRTYCRDLLFWPGSRTLASASGDQTIYLWNLASLRSNQQHPSQTDAPTPAPEQDPENPTIPQAPTVIHPTRTLRGHRLEVWSLALCPDQTTLLSGAKDGQVCAWDTARTQPHQALQILPVRVRSWTFLTNDSDLLTLDHQAQVTRWTGPDFELATPILQLPSNDLMEACFSPDGQWIAFVTRTGELQVRSLTQRGNNFNLPGPSGRLRLVGFLPGTLRLLTYDPRTDTLRCWDLPTSRPVWEWDAAPLLPPAKPALVPDGPWLVAPAPGDEIRLLHIPSRRTETIPLPIRQITAAALSPDARWLAAVTLQGTGLLWDRHQHSPVSSFHGFLQGAHSVTFSPDGRRIAIGSNGTEAVKLWDTESLQELLTLPGRGSMFHATAFSPDGNVLASCSSRGELHLWRAPSFEEIARIETTPH